MHGFFYLQPHQGQELEKAMASFDIQGEIHSIDETRTYGQNGFTKREFVIKLTGEGENPSYPNYVALEFVKDKCSLLDSYQKGDEVKVAFNLGGRLWTPPGKPERCFVSLQAWRIEKLSGVASQEPPADWDNFNQAPPPSDDDFPF